MKPQDAASALARMYRGRSWYHRATVVEERDAKRTWHAWVRVWGTGPRPRELPHSFRGVMIEWCRVSPQHPCPFGSVKADDKEAA